MTAVFCNRPGRARGGGECAAGRGNRRPHGFRSLRLEALESRALLSVSVPGIAVPDYMALATPAGVAPLSTAGPTGYTPAEIRQAYGFNNITFDNGTVVGNGSGTTIAIVDAYDDPDIANDLHQFDLQFGLPDPVFTKVNQTGGTNLPRGNKSWATEIALDVEWAHAIAPEANILLVEANSASLTNLLTAVSYAASAAGVVAVSMSWSSDDFAGENAYDSYFTTPSGHAGVTFLAASGDTAAPPGYPAISPNVVAVGGTTLNLDSQGNWLSESGWSDSGGGISAYETQPSYQKGVVTQSTTFRTNPDVAYDSDPNTGFPVYDSYNNPVSAPWGQWGGTSDAAPQWAGLIAIADQGRILAGKGSLDGATQTLPLLYSLPSTDFHDITSGTSTGSPEYSAGPGYDLVTGRGTPIANLVVNGLGASVSSTSPTGTAPTVGGVVVAEAVPKYGVLQSNEQGVISWAVTDANPIASSLLLIDGKSISPIYGPYGPYGSSYYYSGVFGPLAAGSHSYTIQVTDSTGMITTIQGTFVVAPAQSLISGVVVAEAVPTYGVLESNEEGVISWAVTDVNPIVSKSLTVDGSPAAALYGPYGPYGSSYYYSGTFGPLAAGSHSYVIQVTDSVGASSTYTGSFTVVAAPALVPAALAFAVPLSSPATAQAVPLLAETELQSAAAQGAQAVGGAGNLTAPTVEFLGTTAADPSTATVSAIYDAIGSSRSAAPITLHVAGGDSSALPSLTSPTIAPDQQPVTDQPSLASLSWQASSPLAVDRAVGAEAADLVFASASWHDA